MMLRGLLPPVSYIQLILLATISLPAGAATFTVTNLNDSGTGSLRQAISDANATRGTDTIAFQTGLTGTITLTSGQMNINDDLTLQGPGVSVLAISGNNASRVFSIKAGINVFISNLTLKDGRDPCCGAAIVMGRASLTITNVTLTNHTAVSGAAIYNDVGGGGLMGRQLTIVDSIFSNNSASEWGGAIYNIDVGTITVENSTFTNNSAQYDGGAIYNVGKLAISNTTLSGNSASKTGGGLYNIGIVTVENSTFTNSLAQYDGGAIYNIGNLTISDSTLSGNSASRIGGGLYNIGIVLDSGIVTLINSTLFGNSAGYAGGGVSNFDGILTITNSTIFGNSAGVYGGGIDNTGVGASDISIATVINSTVSGNSADIGGGLFLYRGSLKLGNSVIAGNKAKDGKEIMKYSGLGLISQGHNLFGENGNSGLVNANPIDSDIILPGIIATAIGPLTNNGGPTLTHLPVAGGPVIDAGDNTLLPADITTDQRGYGPRIIGGTVDIGSVEAGSILPPADATAVGVFRSGTWFLDANGNGAWDGCQQDGGLDLCLFGTFGTTGDMPAAGHWDGGVQSSIGVLRSGTGEWFIDRNGNRQWDGCVADGCYRFGAPGDWPAAGDWTGTGFAKIGVFRHGQWYLDANGNGQWDGCGVDLCFAFGQFGDLPVAGNWDGGSKAGVGVFRAGTWYLDYNGNGQWDGCQQDGGQDQCLYGSFGQGGDLPAAGDWNGDGKAKVGVFRNGTWYLDYNGNGAWDGCGTDRCYVGSFGMKGDLPVAGQW